MKKYVSVFMLCARLSVYKVAFFGGLIYMGLLICYLDYQRERFLESTPYAFHYLLDESRLRLFMSLAWVGMLVLLCIWGCNMRKSTRFLLWRLRISKWTVWLIQTIYHGICLIIMWAIQVAAVGTMYICYLQLDNTEVSVRTFGLECYKSKVLRGLLPMEDVGLWAFRLFAAGLCAVVTAWIVTGVWKGEES